MIDEECGQDCGNLQTVFLKVILILLLFAQLLEDAPHGPYSSETLNKFKL